MLKKAACLALPVATVCVPFQEKDLVVKPLPLCHQHHACRRVFHSLYFPVKFFIYNMVWCGVCLCVCVFLFMFCIPVVSVCVWGGEPRDLEWPDWYVFISVSLILGPDGVLLYSVSFSFHCFFFFSSFG